MTPLYEKIKAQIPTLTEAEQFGLYAQLRHYFEEELKEGSDHVLLNPEWEMEIESRLINIDNGSMELIAADVADREIDAVFARHGITRMREAA